MTENFWQNQKRESAQPAGNETLNLPTLVGNDIENMRIVASYSGNSRAAQIFRSTYSAVGEVIAQRNPGSTDVDQGTGFFVNSDGAMVTDLHVLYGTRGNLNVKLADGEVLPARVIATDASSDLAVLQVTPSRPGETFNSIKLGNSNEISDTSRFMEIGYPDDVMHVSFGSLNRETHLGTYAMDKIVPGNDLSRMVIESSAPTHTGESGGPLLNSNGEAVGVIDLAGVASNPFGVSTPIESLKNLLNSNHIAYESAPAHVQLQEQQPTGTIAHQLQWHGEPHIPRVGGTIGSVIMGQTNRFVGSAPAPAPAGTRWGMRQQSAADAPSISSIKPDINEFKYVLGSRQ